MNLIEFLGFVATFAVMVFLSVRRSVEKRRQQDSPHRLDDNEIASDANQAKKVFQDLNLKLKTAAQKKNRSMAYSSPGSGTKKQESFYTPTKYPPHPDLVLADKYEVIRREKTSTAHRLLGSLKSPRDMLVIKEIFDKPLSMRRPEDRMQ